ncbi:MAG: hypothetical protein P1U61_09160 [Legionellaceae bacterium]|nr:hypothetical protein [Legionellaceae bacterium]
MEKNSLGETLVLSIDFDACTDTENTRKQLLNRIVNFISEYPQYKQLIVCIGSARQSIWLDFFNATQKRQERYQSCCILGVRFIDELQTALGQDITVSFEPILTSDVYSELPLGTTFSFMKTTRYQTYHVEKEAVHIEAMNTQNMPVEMFNWNGKRFNASKARLTELSSHDIFKRDICYMQMHQVARRLGPSTRFSFILIDDKGDILAKLKSFFSQNKSLIPTTCMFKCTQHAPYRNQDFRHIHFSGISWMQGAGEHNVAFEKTMQALRASALQTTLSPLPYEQKYALYLSQFADKCWAADKASELDVDDLGYKADIECGKVNDNTSVVSPQAGGLEFTMQVMRYAAPPVGICIALGFCLFGETRFQRQVGAASGVLIASPWLAHHFFASHKKTEVSESFSYDNTL